MVTLGPATGTILVFGRPADRDTYVVMAHTNAQVEALEMLYFVKRRCPSQSRGSVQYNFFSIVAMIFKRGIGICDTPVTSNSTTPYGLFPVVFQQNSLESALDLWLRHTAPYDFFSTYGARRRINTHINLRALCGFKDHKHTVRATHVAYRARAGVVLYPHGVLRFRWLMVQKLNIYD